MITDAKVLRELNHRDQLPDFLNRHGLTGAAAELGVFRGDFSEIILSTWSGGELFLIDPYAHFPDYVDGTAIDHVSGAPLDFDQIDRNARVRLERFPDAKFIRDTSANVGRAWTRKLDMIFVDANHARTHVENDISIWWPHLNVGGVIGFHDFYTRDDQYLKCGVFDAVMDLADSIFQRPHVTCCTTAWLVKTPAVAQWGSVQFK